MSSVGAGYSYETGIPEFFLLVVAEMTRPTVHGAVGSAFGAGMCLGELGHWVVTAWTCGVCWGGWGQLPRGSMYRPEQSQEV